MRKVDFSGWSDVGRFAKYARDHLQAAKIASSQLEYWETLYDLLTHGKLTSPPQQVLTPQQTAELSNLQKQLSQLPDHERYSLRKSIEYRHRTTLDLLKKMSQAGILNPQDFSQYPAISRIGKRPPLNHNQWAVAFDQHRRPLIEGGQLKLYLTKAPAFGDNLRRALDEAVKLKTECGTPAKLGFFLGYLGRATLRNLQGRPYQNSLTDREAREIQSTNEMIKFIQNEWKIKPPHQMKVPSQKNIAPDKTISAVSPENPPPAPVPPSSATGPSIVNHITIQGAMHGDIGFQRNQPPDPSPLEKPSFPHAYPNPNGHPSHFTKKTVAPHRRRDTV
jgi:hypothetical protein